MHHFIHKIIPDTWWLIYFRVTHCFSLFCFPICIHIPNICVGTLLIIPHYRELSRVTEPFSGIYRYSGILIFSVKTEQHYFINRKQWICTDKGGGIHKQEDNHYLLVFLYSILVYSTALSNTVSSLQVISNATSFTLIPLCL